MAGNRVATERSQLGRSKFQHIESSIRSDYHRIDVASRSPAVAWAIRRGYVATPCDPRIRSRFGCSEVARYERRGRTPVVLRCPNWSSGRRQSGHLRTDKSVSESRAKGRGTARIGFEVVGQVTRIVADQPTSVGRCRTVGSRVEQAHNPEVAGSHPAPVYDVSAGQGHDQRAWP